MTWAQIICLRRRVQGRGQAEHQVTRASVLGVHPAGAT